MKLWLHGILVLALVVPAYAKGGKGKEAPRPKPGAAIKKVVKDINAALRKADVETLDSHYTRAVNMRGNYDAAKLMPVARAVGKGVSHKNEAIASKSISTLGALGVPGSGKLLGKLLAPPAKVKEERVGLHEQAIRAAAAIHDPATLKQFDKLILHPVPEIAVAGAEAFGGYTALDTKPKDALVKKLVASLGKLQKKHAAAPDEKKAGLAKVIDGLNVSLAKLTGQKFTTHADWTKWIKERAKA